MATCSRDQMIKVWGADDATLAYKMREKRIVTALAMDRNGVVTGKQASKQARCAAAAAAAAAAPCFSTSTIRYAKKGKRKKKKENDILEHEK